MWHRDSGPGSAPSVGTGRSRGTWVRGEGIRDDRTPQHSNSWRLSLTDLSNFVNERFELGQKEKFHFEAAR